MLHTVLAACVHQAHDLLEDELQGALDFGELEVDGNQRTEFVMRQQTDALLHEATELALKSESLFSAERAQAALAGAGAKSGAALNVETVFVAFDERGKHRPLLAQDAWLCCADAASNQFIVFSRTYARRTLMGYSAGGSLLPSVYVDVRAALVTSLPF